MANEVVIHIKASDAASGPIRGIGDAARGTLGPLNALGDTLRRVTAVGIAMGGAVLGLGVTLGVKFAADLEQARIGFTTMLGSAEQADAFLRDMMDFAEKTPFEFPELLDASRRMMAFGFASEDVLPMLTDIGDAVAAMGQSGEAVQRVTYALGQMSTAGRVSAQDMMQLTSVGIEGWRYLAEATGKSIAEVRKLAEEGMLDARVAIQVILAGMRKDYAGTMEAQSRTFLGLMSTLKDAARITLGKIMMPLFEALKDAAADMARFVDTATFDEWAENAREQLGRVVSFVRGDMLPAFGNLGETLARIDPDYITRIVQALAAFAALSATVTVVSTMATALGGLAVAIGVLGSPVGLAAMATVIGMLYELTHPETAALRNFIEQGLYAEAAAFMADAEAADKAAKAHQDWARSLTASKAALAGIAAQERATEVDIEELNKSVKRGGTQLGNYGSSLIIAGNKAKTAKDAFAEAGFSVQDMARAYAEADPRVRMLGLRIVGMKDQLAGVNAALEANAAEQRAIQDAIAATRERISQLSSALSEAKARLQDLAAPHLVGMGKLEDQIFAIEQNIKRLQLVAAGGVLPAGMAMPKGTIADLQAQLERLRLLREVTFEPQLRALAAAAQPPAAEMTFGAAMAAIAATRAQIASLEGQLASANTELVSQEAHLRDVQAAADGLRASAAELQRQIDATESARKTLIDDIVNAFIWLTQQSAKVKELGGSVAEQAVVVDEAALKFLTTFGDFSLKHTGTIVSDVQSMTQAWQDAYDKIEDIAAGIKAAIAGIGALSIPGFQHGGIGAPSIYGGQHGGIVTRPTLMLLGEHGPEAIVPLNAGGGFAGAGHLTVEVPVYLDREMIARAVWDSLKHRRGAGFALGLA